MIVGFVQLSGEAHDLAVGELEGAAVALGGTLPSAEPGVPELLTRVLLPAESELKVLAGRLALARRTLLAVEGAGVDAATREGADGATAAFRRLGTRGGTADPAVRRLGKAYVDGGGRIDLDAPDRRYWWDPGRDGTGRLFREVSAVDRAATAARAMPHLPFRRPVSLPPRLARAATNLAAVRPGSRVLDPFVGTGALLAEAALLGARVYGVDADASMVRGALRNFQHLGIEADAMVEGDARSVELAPGPVAFDALVTDPPYGRSSWTGGASASELTEAVLARWSRRVRPGGRLVVVSPGPPPTLPVGWTLAHHSAVRAHRSLTRQFWAFRRAVQN